MPWLCVAPVVRGFTRERRTGGGGGLLKVNLATWGVARMSCGECALLLHTLSRYRPMQDAHLTASKYSARCRCAFLLRCLRASCRCVNVT